MPATKPSSRKQRHKSKVSATAKKTVNAAVSIDTSLYLAALHVAERLDEGNFSRYVRKLIKKDLGRVA